MIVHALDSGVMWPARPIDRVRVRGGDVDTSSGRQLCPRPEATSGAARGRVLTPVFNATEEVGDKLTLSYRPEAMTTMLRTIARESLTNWYRNQKTGSTGCFFGLVCKNTLLHTVS